MGTRSLTVIVDNGWGKNKELLVMYRQFDGYPSGHGKELKEFLAPIAIVNGINPDKGARIANGAGCLAAQMLAHFKDGPGGFYVHAAGSRDCGEEYTYIVTVGPEGAPLQLEVLGGSHTIYSGLLRDFDPEKDEEEAA